MGPSAPTVSECSSLATGAPASVVVGFVDAVIGCSLGVPQWLLANWTFQLDK
jgi:hypothetical protein